MDLLDSLVDLRNRSSDEDAAPIQSAINEIRRLRRTLREAETRLRPAIAHGMEPSGVLVAVNEALRAMSASQ